MSSDFALLAPIGGWAVGSWIGGPVGGAIGWMVGSWVMNSVMDQGNDILDPGAEEMPRINNAIRGATVPVLFGTNRVPSQIVWANNYTVVREESGSGGKPGGSGGGKAPAGAGEAAYSYYWDLIYHMGMSDDQMSMFNIWLGPDKIDSDIVTAIAANSGTSSSISFFSSLLTLQEQDEGPTIRFTSSYFYPGGQSDSWDHLDGVVGSTIRWPYTIWLGFEQLSLGSYPRVPQYNFEIGPNGVSDNSESAPLGARQASTSGSSYQKANGEFSGRDIYGQSYLAISAQLGGANTIQVIAEDGTIVEQVSNSNAFQQIIDQQADDNGNYNYIGGVNVIGDGRYVAIVFGNYSPSHSNFNWEHLSLWRPVNGAFPELICSYRCIIGFSNVTGGDDAVVILGTGSDADTIVTFASNSNGVHRFRFYPSINEYESLAYKDGGPGVSSPRKYEVLHRIKNGDTARLSSPLMQLDVSNSNGNNKVAGFVPVGAGKIIFYLSDQIQQWHNDNPASGSRWQYNTEVIEPSYPDGAMVQIDLGTVTPYISYSSTDFGESDVTVINTSFVDLSGTQVCPFDDDNSHLDDTAGLNEYKTRNLMIKWLDEAGLFAALVIPKFFTNSADQDEDSDGKDKVWIKFRVFIFNSLTNTYTEYVNSPPIYVMDHDSAVALGWGGLGGGGWVPQWGMRLHIDPTTFELSFGGTLGPSITGHDPEAFYLNPSLGALPMGVGGDLTPAEIIRRILQDDIYGRGLSNTIVDQTSFAVAHQYCLDSGFLVSTQYRGETGNLAIIQQLLSLYDGFLTVTDGQIKFGVRELTLAPVRTIDNDHLVIDQEGDVPIKIAKGAAKDTYNKIRVNYISRSLDYQQDQIEVGDEVDQDFTGTRLKEFPPQFVMTPEMATIIGYRALWGNLYARDIYEFNLGLKDQDLTPGDVVTLVDSVTGLQADARIMSWHEKKPYVFACKAIQEFNYINASSIDNVNVSSPTNPVIQKNVGLPIVSQMYELPREYSWDGLPRLFANYYADGAPAGATLYVSADGVSYAAAQTMQPYPLGGSIIGGLPEMPGGTFNEDVEVFLFPSSGYETNATSQFTRNATLNEVLGPSRAVGAGSILVGSEMMAYEGVTLVSQNRYRLSRLYRGYNGTNIQSHAAGAFWLKHGGGIFHQTYDEDDIGTLLYYKIVPFDFQGNPVSVSSVTAQTYTIQGTHFRPQVPSELHLIVGSVDRYNNYKSLMTSVTPGVSIPLDWRDTARVNGYGAGGYGLGTYGRFTTDTLSHAWRVEVIGSGDVVVRSTTVGTTHYTYTASDNMLDNGAWRGNVAIKVTPFGEYGDAPRFSVASLEIWF